MPEPSFLERFLCLTLLFQAPCFAKNCRDELVFNCGSNVCISQFDLCDGIENCEDGSDEISSQCQNVKCHKDWFRCSYGACIEKSLKCNGDRDCRDGSDEILCISTSCSKDKFSCGNGTCINKNLLCDGKNDCENGLDETIANCSQLTTEKAELSGNPVGPNQEKSCTIPVSRVGTLYYLYSHFCKGQQVPSSCKLLLPNSLVGHGTAVSVSCSKRYDFYDPYTICDDGVWKPSPECEGLCSPLVHPNLEMQCTFNGKPYQCNFDARPNTLVEIWCPHLYDREDFGSPKKVLKCQSDGSWNTTVFKCIPRCGLRNDGAAVATIINGTQTKNNEFPWMAAIYLDGNFICAGTLVTLNKVLTALHCTKKPQFSEDHVLIALGKHHFRLSVVDEFQQVLGVKRIIKHSDFYNDYRNDLAIFILNASVSVSNFVMPICIDYSLTGANLEHQQLAFAGWGYTEENKLSEVLLSTYFQIIDKLFCIRTVKKKNDLDTYITYDKFCATGNGSTLGGFDGGGSLTYYKPSNSLYYIAGVNPLKLLDNIVVFTNFSFHADWLRTQLSK